MSDWPLDLLGFLRGHEMGGSLFESGRWVDRGLAPIQGVGMAGTRPGPRFRILMTPGLIRP